MLIEVSQAEKIILSELRSFGIETISLEKGLGRILAKPLLADRDFPPFDRVTMDGIAIKYQAFLEGTKQFLIQNVQSAGEKKMQLLADNQCIEVMTGAILPENTDTIIRYEDTEIKNGVAHVISAVTFRQNVHFRGEDRKKNDLIVSVGTKIGPAEIAIAASIGAHELFVKKLPKVAIITTGDELVAIDKTPEIHQIRTSNVYAIASLLNKYGVDSTKIHLKDKLSEIVNLLQKTLKSFDIIILSGGVSMGRKDFIPQALEQNGVEKLFYKISQTPGKPFWFGKKGEKLVFALPGNPVSTYLCMLRYVLPWLDNSLNINNIIPEFAELSEDFSIGNSLTNFVQVIIFQENSKILAKPLKGHGSGDFANLIDVDAFLELPAFERNQFKKGEVFRIWRLY